MIAYILRNFRKSRSVLVELRNKPGKMRLPPSEIKEVRIERKVTKVTTSDLNQYKVILLALLSTKSPLPPQRSDPRRQR